jgi:hypothetical protein
MPHPLADYCPLYPQKRTLLERVGMSALCQKQTVQEILPYSITLSAVDSTPFYSMTSSASAMSFTNGCILICINAVARKHKCDVLATRQIERKRRVTMSKMRICFLAAVAAAGIGLGGTFGASAVPMNGNLVGATAPAPELQKVYYYHRYARRQYRRAYRRGYYGGYYGGYNPGYYGGYYRRY